MKGGAISTRGEHRQHRQGAHAPGSEVMRASTTIRRELRARGRSPGGSPDVVGVWCAPAAEGAGAAATCAMLRWAKSPSHATRRPSDPDLPHKGGAMTRAAAAGSRQVRPPEGEAEADLVGRGRGRGKPFFTDRAGGFWRGPCSSASGPQSVKEGGLAQIRQMVEAHLGASARETAVGATRTGGVAAQRSGRSQPGPRPRFLILMIVQRILGNQGTSDDLTNLH